MARKRYIKDYRLVETMDARGRIQTSYEYIGPAYGYVLGPEAVRREKRRVLRLLVLGWLAFVGALLPDARAMHGAYVALPFVFTALPLGLLTDLAFTAMPKSEPLRHQQADLLANRYPPAALWTAILPGIALAGMLVRLLVTGDAAWGDGVFAACALALIACGGVLYSRRSRFSCRELDGETAPKGE